VKKCFEDAKIRVAQLGSADALCGVRHESLEGFHKNEPGVNAAGVRRFGSAFPSH
jgi:hypothetical protein